MTPPHAPHGAEGVSPEHPQDAVRGLVGTRTLATQLNVAGAGPLCTAAFEALTELVRSHHLGGYEGRDALLGHFTTARRQVAELMGSLPHLISFQPSVSAVVTMLSRSVPLAPDDQVLTWDVEYASNIRAWHIRTEEVGAELVRVQPPLDRPWDTGHLLEQVTDRTRVVTVSSVQSFDGSVTDLYALRKACDEVGALLLVDLSQHLGIAEARTAVALADAAYAATHKWLLGPVGTAVASFTPDLLAQLRPPAYGSSSIDRELVSTAAVWFDPSLPLREDVGLLEAGTPAYFNAVAAGRAAAALSAVGVEQVQQRALDVRQQLCDLLADHGLTQMPTVVTATSPIVAVRPGPEQLRRLVPELERRAFSHVVRGDILRLSPWAPDACEVGRMLEHLDDALLGARH